jgi:uncharacterized protein
MFIDIHSHAYRYQYPDENGNLLFITPDELMERHDSLMIEKAVLLPIVSPEVYVPQSVGEIIEICDNSGGRFIPFCNVDPRVLTNTGDAPLGRLLEYYKNLGCRGIGEVMPNLELKDKRLHNLFRHVQEIGFPLIFDITGRLGKGYGIYDDPGLTQLRECLEKFPNLFFIGHGPAFWAEMGTLDSVNDRYGYPSYPIREEGSVPKLMREYPNLMADLSAMSGYNALTRDYGYGVSFINEFRDKLYFGTDICTFKQVSHISGYLMSLKDKGEISEETFNKIARENTKNLLKI